MKVSTALEACHMGPSSSLAMPTVKAPLREGVGLAWGREQVEAAVREVLEQPDEAGLDRHWTRSREQVREYALRGGRRERAALVVAGWCLGRGGAVVPAGVWRFAAGVELLHTGLELHDDVAERAWLRRGGLALHHLLAPGREGEDLAVVVGDHLLALGMEAMLGSGLPGAGRACRHYLGVSRQTAVGQYQELRLARTSLREVGVLRMLRVVNLRAARHGLRTPLGCGGLLGGAGGATREALERVGRNLGLSWQLREELRGLLGEGSGAGCRSGSDFVRGRWTYALVAAYARAFPEQRRELEALWALPAERKDEAALARVRALVEACGGWEGTERLVASASRSARRGLSLLPRAGGVREWVDALIGEERG